MKVRSQYRASPHRHSATYPDGGLQAVKASAARAGAAVHDDPDLRLAIGAPAFTAVSAAGQQGGDAGWYPAVRAEIGASTPRRRPETVPANKARRCLKAGLLASGTDQQGIVG